MRPSASLYRLGRARPMAVRFGPTDTAGSSIAASDAAITTLCPDLIRASTSGKPGVRPRKAWMPTDLVRGLKAHESSLAHSDVEVHRFTFPQPLFLNRTAADDGFAGLAWIPGTRPRLSGSGKVAAESPPDLNPGSSCPCLPRYPRLAAPGLGPWMAGTSPDMTIFGCTVDTSVSHSPLYEAEPDSRGSNPAMTFSDRRHQRGCLKLVAFI